MVKKATTTIIIITMGLKEVPTGMINNNIKTIINNTMDNNIHLQLEINRLMHKNKTYLNRTKTQRLSHSLQLIQLLLRNQISSSNNNPLLLAITHNTMQITTTNTIRIITMVNSNSQGPVRFNNNQDIINIITLIKVRNKRQTEKHKMIRINLINSQDSDDGMKEKRCYNSTP